MSFTLATLYGWKLHRFGTGISIQNSLVMMVITNTKKM